MKTMPPDTTTRNVGLTVLFLVATALTAVVAAHAAGGRLGGAERSTGAAPRVYTITYVAHNGVEREATVLLPAGYGPRSNRPLPLVISPHGRGATGRSNATFWGNLPTVGSFAVVNPDGMGRRLANRSYGF